MIISYKNEKLDTDKLPVLGGHCEGMVYSHNGDAIKVYHDYTDKIRLTQSECEELMKVNTKRILLCKDLVYEVNGEDLKFKGFSTKEVKNPIPLTQIGDLLPKYIREESKYYEEDINNLSDHRIAISDLEYNGNMLCNNEGIYFVDCGNFSCNGMDNVKKTNLEHLNEALHGQLFLLGKDQESLELELSKIFDSELILTEEFRDFIIKVYEEAYDADFDLNNYKNYLVFLEDILSEYKSLENYKRELLENALDYGNYQYSNPYELEVLERLLKR